MPEGLIRNPKSEIRDGVAHLWRFSLLADAAAEAAGTALLAPDERERAQRFHFPEHRRRFVIARSTLRTLLGEYLGVDPAEVCFRYGAQGKPSLDLPGIPDLRFNLSHSGDQALCGVVWGADVGVDVETLAERSNAESLARRFFHPLECEALSRREGAALQTAFYQLWTLKEAYIKAVGGGLSIPLRQFAFAVPDGPGPVPLLAAEPIDERGRWSAFAVATPEGYAAGLVVEGSGWRIEEREWVP